MDMTFVLWQQMGHGQHWRLSGIITKDVTMRIKLKNLKIMLAQAG